MSSAARSSPVTSLRYAAASGSLKRRSAARISTSSPRARSRARGSAGSARGTDHQVHVRREVLEQVGHARLDVRPVDEVVVVEHQVDVVRHGAELVEHRSDDGADGRLSRLQQRERIPPGAGHNPFQGRDDVGPEGRGPAVALVQRHPGGEPVLRFGVREPLRQQRRLAESGRCGDERKPGLEPAAQALAQPRARHKTSSRPRDVELGLDERVCHHSSPLKLSTGV
jgi:hypothetical protein